MRRVLYYSLGGKNIHLSRLSGAFVIFVALIMFFKSGAQMIDSWDNISFVNDCLGTAEGDLDAFGLCQENADKALDVYVRPGQSELNSKQFAMSILPPIAWVLLWMVVLALGLAFYRTGKFVIPIKEREELEKLAKKARKKAKKNQLRLEEMNLKKRRKELLLESGSRTFSYLDHSRQTFYSKLHLSLMAVDWIL